MKPGREQRQHVRISREVGNRRNLILRHRIKKNPAEVIAIVVLIIASQIGIVLFALIVVVRIAQSRRFQAAVRCDVAVQGVVTKFFTDRASIFKRRVHSFIGSAEDLHRAESRFRAALARDIHEYRRLIPVLRFHPAQDDVGPLPGPGGNNIGK